MNHPRSNSHPHPVHCGLRYALAFASAWAVLGLHAQAPAQTHTQVRIRVPAQTATENRRWEDVQPHLVTTATSLPTQRNVEQVAEHLSKVLYEMHEPTPDSSKAVREFQGRHSRAPSQATAEEERAIRQMRNQINYHIIHGHWTSAIQRARDTLGEIEPNISYLARDDNLAQRILDICAYAVNALHRTSHVKEAEEQAVQCRRLTPHREAEEVYHPPYTRKYLQTAGSHTPSDNGSFTIHSEPQGCTAYANGQRLGPTPYTFHNASPGNYDIQVECGEANITASRIHSVLIGHAEDHIYVDPEFDNLMHTESRIAFRYQDHEQLRKRYVSDALFAGQVLGAAHLWSVVAEDFYTVRVDKIDMGTGRITATATYNAQQRGPHLQHQIEIWLKQADRTQHPWRLESFSFRTNPPTPISPTRHTPPTEGEGQALALIEHFGVHPGLTRYRGGGPAFLQAQVYLVPYMEAAARTPRPPNNNHRSHNRRPRRNVRLEADPTMLPTFALITSGSALLGTWGVWSIIHRDGLDDRPVSKVDRGYYHGMAITAGAFGVVGLPWLFKANGMLDRWDKTKGLLGAPLWTWAVGSAGLLSTGFAISAAARNGKCVERIADGQCSVSVFNSGMAWAWAATAAPLLSVPLSFMLKRPDTADSADPTATRAANSRPRLSLQPTPNQGGLSLQLSGSF